MTGTTYLCPVCLRSFDGIKSYLEHLLATNALIGETLTGGVIQ